MFKPSALRAGSRVAVVAPASPFPRDDFACGIAELRRRGFDPVFDERVFERQQYLAGDSTTRAESFLEAWRDPDIAAVVAARGGYGSVQLLPLLTREALTATPKLFVGCSDLTSILSVLTTTCGIVAVHGPMVAGQLGRGAAGYDEASWLSALCRTGAVGRVGPADLDVFVGGEAEGLLFGGNLTQLAASLGTPYAFDPPDDCILFLEDIGERPYRIDRLLTQLRLAGILSRASAFVFGEMLNCDEPDGAIRARDVIRDYVSGFPGPVIFGLAAGHTAGPALTLPLGVQARVSATSSGALFIEESAVV
jgi:muramoyltetrapeptide carboxypeptidase